MFPLQMSWSSRVRRNKPRAKERMTRPSNYMYQRCFRMSLSVRFISASFATPLTMPMVQCIRQVSVAVVGLGRTVTCGRHIRASLTPRRFPYLFDINPERKHSYICIYRNVRRAKKDAMALKEMNRLKSNCRAKSSIYTLFLGHCLLPCGLMAIYAIYERSKSH